MYTDAELDMESESASSAATTGSKRRAAAKAASQLSNKATSSALQTTNDIGIRNDGNINTGDAVGEVEEYAEEEAEEEEEITRCICGSDELYIPKKTNGEFDNVDPGFFIQCEKCSVWQHGYCVGIKDEENAPEKYWCEQCKPEYHTHFVDKFGIRRTTYDPLKPRTVSDPPSTVENGLKKGTRRSHSGRNHSGSDGDSIASGNSRDDLHRKRRSSTEADGDGDRDREIVRTGDEDDVEGEFADDDFKRKHRRRSSYYSYEEQLRKALAESAKEANVTPEEANISASEGPEGRETRLRKTRGKYSHSEEEETPIKTEKHNGIEVSSKLKNERRRSRDSKRPRRGGVFGESEMDSRSENNPDTHNEEEIDEDVTSGTNTGIGNNVSSPSKSRHPTTSLTSKKEGGGKRGGRKEKKEPKAAELKAEDRPFRANIPSARINMNEMTRRVYSIMDFVSNIQINLSNEEDFKNNLFKMDDAELTPEIIQLKERLVGCYNTSVQQLDSLTSLLNNWQNEHM